MFRLYTISAIIGLALAGLAFVSQNSPLLKEENKIAQNQSENLNNLVTGKPFVESLTVKNSNNQANLKENLTEDFTKGIGKIIYENNPSGPQDFYGENVLNAPDPDQIAENLLAEAAQKFDPNSLRAEIKDSDLNISSKSDEESLKTYISNLQKIVQQSAKKIPQEILLAEEPSIAQLVMLADIYQETINELYKLSVPSAATQIHKKQLILISAKKNIFEKISEYEQDPLTAILVAKEMQKIDLEFSELSKEFLKFIEDNKI